MEYFILDANQMLDKQKAHQYIASVLSFPEYYGQNLDALFDMLTDISSPTTITLTHINVLKEQPDDSYSKLFLKVFEDSAKKNDFLTVLFETA